MKNWKTTLFGLLVLIFGGLAQAAPDEGWRQVLAGAGMAAAGLGLVLAKDAEKKIK